MSKINLMAVWKEFQDLTFEEIKQVVYAADTAAIHEANDIRWRKGQAIHEKVRRMIGVSSSQKQSRRHD